MTLPTRSRSILSLTRSARYRRYREPQERREQLPSAAGCMSWAAGEWPPTPPMRWTSLMATGGHWACHSIMLGATSRPILMARPTSGWQAATSPALRRPTWKSSTAPSVLAERRLRQLRRQRQQWVQALRLPRHVHRRQPQQRQPQLLQQHLPLLRRPPRGPLRQQDLVRRRGKDHDWEKRALNS